MNSINSSSISMTKKTLNPCTRCGQERVLQKTWKEDQITIMGKIQSVTFGQTICPNPDCQKIVDQEIKVLEEKQASLKKKRESNDFTRKKNSLEMANKARKNKSRI